MDYSSYDHRSVNILSGISLGLRRSNLVNYVQEVSVSSKVHIEFRWGGDLEGIADTQSTSSCILTWCLS